MDNKQGGQPSSTKGMARSIIEKNRRNLMKDLCSKLFSLLPINYSPRGGTLSVGDQIDETITYIKNLETRVKVAQQKKEEILAERKRFRSDCSSSASEAPKIEIHEMGSSLKIILTCEFGNQFILSEIIRILYEENTEVMSVHSSLSGNTMLHVVHAQIQQSFQLGTAAISERLKRFVDGYCENFEG